MVTIKAFASETIDRLLDSIENAVEPLKKERYKPVDRIQKAVYDLVVAYCLLPVHEQSQMHLNKIYRLAIAIENNSLGCDLETAVEDKNLLNKFYKILADGKALSNS